MILSYDAYAETVHHNEMRDATIASLSDKVMKLALEFEEFKKRNR